MLRGWKVRGLARMLAVCSLAALLLAVCLLISLAVSAQSVTQRPAQVLHRAANASTQPTPVAPFRPIVIDLGAACAGQSYTYAVNAGGMVASQCYFDGSFRGTIWQNNAWDHPLAGSFGLARALNDAGLAVGNSMITGTAWQGEAWRAVVWDQGVIYSSRAAGMHDHAVLWANRVVTDLGDLGGGYSTAYGINDLGQIVGDSAPPVGCGQLLQPCRSPRGRLGSLGQQLPLSACDRAPGTLMAEHGRDSLTDRSAPAVAFGSTCSAKCQQYLPEAVQSRC